MANLHELIAIAHAKGFQVGTHATGDVTIDAVVAGYVKAMGRRGGDPRHAVIHGDLTPEATLRTMAPPRHRREHERDDQVSAGPHTRSRPRHRPHCPARRSRSPPARARKRGAIMGRSSFGHGPLTCPRQRLAWFRQCRQRVRLLP
ncbi:hypothetical protein [Nonomuraea polychroma]|uniref:hypothetical protein n=1 Tax=Nonomuraea polychroma TaxID=46176 RepID=UPI003BA8FA2F